MKKLWFGLPVLGKIVSLVVVIVLIAAVGFQFIRPLQNVLAEITTFFAVDDNGADDYPGQKDLNFLERKEDTTLPGILYVNWGFDNTDWSGNNTGDGCALFDTDGDGFANYAYCVTINGAPAAIKYEQLWSCGDDAPDKCTQPINQVVNPNSTATFAFGEDPFGTVTSPYFDPNHITGNTCSYTTDPYSCYTNDSVVSTTITLSEMTGGTPNLINVCSYPSEQPNSAPSDCVFIPGAGFLNIVKIADPSDGTPFTFNLGTGQASANGTSIWTIYGSGSVETISFEPGTYDLTEATLPTGWLLNDASCVVNGATPTPTGTLSGMTITDFEIQTGLSTTCTFTNWKQRADVTVVKDDKWYWDPVQLMYVERWVPRGGFFTYNIHVSYPTSEFTEQTATNVVMTDTLDPNVSYFESQDPVITDPYSLAPVCTEPTPGGGGTFSCTVASMAEGQDYTVAFTVQVLETSPMGGLIESGECTTNPNKQGDFDVDVCNLVSVATDTTEYDYTNNDDSEPTDIGKSTAVTLTDFAATGASKSVILTWETTSETDNAGFNLYRANSLNGKKVLINKEGLIESLAAGNPWGAVYEYVDDGLKVRKVYFYWLEDVDVYGVTTLHGPVSAKTKK